MLKINYAYVDNILSQKEFTKKVIISNLSFLNIIFFEYIMH